MSNNATTDIIADVILNLKCYINIDNFYVQLEGYFLYFQFYAVNLFTTYILCDYIMCP